MRISGPGDVEGLSVVIMNIKQPCLSRDCQPLRVRVLYNTKYGMSQGGDNRWEIFHFPYVKLISVRCLREYQSIKHEEKVASSRREEEIIETKERRQAAEEWKCVKLTMRAYKKRDKDPHYRLRGREEHPSSAFSGRGYF